MPIDYAHWVDRQSRAAARMSDVIAHVTDWGAPTPCTEWTARDLLAHVVTEQLWIPGLLAGGTIDEVADDLEFRLKAVDESGGPRLAEDWGEVRDGVSAAWRGTSPGATVHLSYGEATVGHYLAQLTSDTAVHAWDLGVSQGVEVEWDDDLARSILSFVRVDLAEDPAPDLFSPPVELTPGPELSARDQVLALTGRDPTRRRPGR